MMVDSAKSRQAVDVVPAVDKLLKICPLAYFYELHSVGQML